MRFSTKKSGDHIWVMYSNPRNGKVKLKACKNCGVSYAMDIQRVRCKEKTPEEHRMERMGWTVSSEQNVALQANS